MEKNEAVKIEGMLLGSRMHLSAVAEHLRTVSEGKKRKDMMLKIGKAMAELWEMSREIYEEHPDLNPHREAEKRVSQPKKAR